MNDHDHFSLVTKSLKDVFINVHTRSYEIITDLHTWEVIASDDLISFSVTHSITLSDGSQQIVKNFS